MKAMKGIREASLLAGGRPGTASANGQLRLLGGRETRRWPSYSCGRPPALTWWHRTAWRMQDALADRRTDISDVLAEGPASSAFCRVARGWLAGSRWLRVGFVPQRRTSRERLELPNPLLDIGCHLVKVSLAVLLLGRLRRSRNSWGRGR